MSNGASSKKNWRVILVDRAQKQKKRIPASDAARINRALKSLEKNPWSGDIDKLEGDEISWRRRVGNYRIIFDILVAQRTVFVYEIKRRTSSTY